MKKDFVTLIMNPVRQRIILYLAVHEHGTVNDIAASLSDIPKPSLYRHIKQLLDGSIIEIKEEKAIRGTIEKTYVLVKNQSGKAPNDDVGMLIHQSLMSLTATFANYFADKRNDPVKDMLCLSTSTLMMTDEEFSVFMSRIGAVIQDSLANEAKEGRKARSFTIVSAPVK